MRNILLLIILVEIIVNIPVPAKAVDEQRQAYDKMVEETVKEADEYVEQKQKQAAEQRAQQQRDAEEQAKEAARLQESGEENKRSDGTHIRSRPIDTPPVVAVPLPSGGDAPGGDGASAVSPASPPAD